MESSLCVSNEYDISSAAIITADSAANHRTNVSTIKQTDLVTYRISDSKAIIATIVAANGTAKH